MRRRRLELCLGPLLLLTAVGCQQSDGDENSPAAQPPPPTLGATEATFRGAPVILVSIDTLRADRLPAWGYEGVETPSIDALADDSILFTNAWSHVPLTLPSHVSVFTGRRPNEHGVRNNLGYRFDAANHPTLAALAAEAGYSTAAAVSAYVLRSATGVAAGFDVYDDGIPSQEGVALGVVQRSGAETIAVARRWLAAHRQRPLFFLHLFEPHAPYEPAEPFASRYGDAYDGEVATVDALVGDFIGLLRELDLYEGSLIVLFSDHGEGLGDHGELEHGVFLYREAIHVPLLLKLPRGEGRGRREERPVQLIDILPTLSELVGLSPPDDLPGVSLLAPASDELARRPVYSETLFPRIHLGWSELYSVLDGRFHFLSAPRPELYDLLSDPEERTNTIQVERAEARRLDRHLTELRTEVEAPTAVSAAEARRLAALGYLGSTASHPEGELPDPKDRIGELEELRRAFALAARDQRPEAVELLQGLLLRNPRSMDARNKLAVTLDELGHPVEALAVYQKGLELDPTLAPEYSLSMASILRKLGRVEEATRHAELALATYEPRARVLLSKLALDRGDLGAAAEAAEKVSGDPTSELAAQVVLAQIDIRRGDLAEALIRLEGAAERGSSFELGPVEGLELTRGDALARLERHQQAEAAFLAEISHFPRKAEPYARLAVLYRVEGRMDETHRILDTLVERVPTLPAHLLAARTLEALGDSDGAVRFRRRAETLAATSPPP